MEASYHEWTWSANLAYDVTPRIRVGGNSMAIHTRSPLSGERYFWIGGAFAQYDFFHEKMNRLFPELSLNIGNYCMCGYDEPYRRGATFYIGWGIGGSIPLSTRLDLDLSFISYQTLHPNEHSYAFTQYVIGLDYRW